MGPPHNDDFGNARQVSDGWPRHDRANPSRQAVPESGFARVAASAAGTGSASAAGTGAASWDRSFSADNSGPRTRRCLLKGCEQPFQPRHPLARYCGAACQAAARRWSRSRAARRYRATAGGKACRRQQASRYRERLRERHRAESTTAAATESESAQQPREGHQEGEFSEKIRCHRPGCYERFSLQPRSPCQRFCGPLCRQALRRVLERERRWRLRWAQRRQDDRSCWRRSAEEGWAEGRVSTSPG